MVVLRQDKNMYDCRVLYIGSAPPIETLKGLEAIQEPLRQRYPKNLEDVEGIDATVCVTPEALEITYLASGQVVQFPLEKLSICAGVRAVNVVDGATGQQVRQFVPVNTVQEDSTQPAIFAAIIRRSKGRQIAECHMFICNCTRDALHLVNAAATANMAFRKQKGQHSQRIEASTKENDVILIQSEISNGYADRGNVLVGNYETQPYRQAESNTIQVDSSVSQNEAKHYQIQQSQVEAPEPNTIYITFDKSNLIQKDGGKMEVSHTARQSRKMEEYSRPAYIEDPPLISSPTLKPMPVPYVDVPTPRQSYTIRTLAPPPPPQPLIVQRPPYFVRPPPPPQPMMFRPPPQRHYIKRVIVPPPPPPRFVSQPPMFVRSRARSASPITRYQSEIRASKKGAYQPKWDGVGRPKSDFAAPRMSRRDMYELQAPPPNPNLEFYQQAGSPREMFLNERAFAHRMHADNRMSREHHGYHYPTAYDLHDAMLYDRPTTKSNPRYSSSSSSSDDGFRNNRLRSSRR